MARFLKKTSVVSAISYLGLSSVLALAFFVVTMSSGKYTSVASYGGALWVFLLSNIVSMPIIIPFWKKRLGG